MYTLFKYNKYCCADVSSLVYIVALRDASIQI